MNIPYWQQRQQMKLKGATSLPGRPREAKTAQKQPIKDQDKDKGSVRPKPGQKKNSTAGKKRIKKRSKKKAKAMRQLGKINKELLGDKTSDIKLLCEIRSPVCTMFATVLNHNAGRDGDQLLNKDDLARCCPPCNDYIESHHEWARVRGFKKRRHGPKK